MLCKSWCMGHADMQPPTPLNGGHQRSDTALKNATCLKNGGCGTVKYLLALIIVLQAHLQSADSSLLCLLHGTHKHSHQHARQVRNHTLPRGHNHRHSNVAFDRSVCVLHRHG